MENLYKTFNNKLEYINSFNNDVAEADYYLYFIGEFMPNIINHAIDNIGLKSFLGIDDIYQVPVNYKLYFMSGLNNELFMRIDTDDKAVFCHLPKQKYGQLVFKIVDFFKKHHIPYEVELDSFILIPKSLDFNTSLSYLIDSVGLEYSLDRKAEDCSKKQLFKSVDNHYHLLSKLVADDIHAKLYESDFLDNYVINTIKTCISALNIHNIEDREKRNFPVKREISINMLSAIDAVINVSNYEMPSFLLIVEEFMKFYNLGEVAYYHDHFAIRFNTNINDLMDAYYEEKQRIAHYTSGDYLLPPDPNAKKVVIK